MSAPVGNGRQDKLDESLMYAPTWVRQRALEDGGPSRRTESPPMAPGIGGPNIDPPPPRFEGDATFEGDLAAVALRRQLSLDPTIMPEPPVAMRQRGPSWLFRLWLILMVAAVVIFIAMWLVGSELAAPRDGQRSDAGISSIAVPPPKPRLVVESQRSYANEPLALGVLLDGTASGETIVLQGLREGTRLSAGNPLGPTVWKLPAADLGKVVAYAPQDFVGTMDARVDLRSQSDRLMDSRLLALEWIAKKADRWSSRDQEPPAKAAPVDAAELAGLLKRAQDFLTRGDIASARLLLRRAANTGSADAALALGATFDGDVLSGLGVMGLVRDIDEARAWYQKAAQMGSIEAERRLKRIESAAK
jgi:hypothetical protein